MKQEEHRVQATCVRWFRLQYPFFAFDLWAIPNGGARSITTAAMLKAEGVTRGVPDLMLSIPVPPYHGLFIEMKTAKGRLSPEQKDFIERHTVRGYKCAVCRSFDDFYATITDYLHEAPHNELDFTQ